MEPIGKGLARIGMTPAAMTAIGLIVVIFGSVIIARGELATGALIYLFGFTGTAAIVATLGVAGIVCCVACTSGDVCNDLKTSI